MSRRGRAAEMAMRCPSCLAFPFAMMLAGLMVLAAAPAWTLQDYFYPAGETWPRQVEINVGGSANITCRINPERYPNNASEMYFKIDDLKLPDENVVVINDTTIVYMLRNAIEQKKVYTCFCGPHAVHETTVYVGAPPRPLKDFACRGFDFEYLECNFTQPENPVLTQYNVTYNLDLPSYFYNTEGNCNYAKSPEVVCNITITRRGEFHFIVNATNALGNRTEHFSVIPIDVMQPARPGDNFKVNRLGTHEAEFTWQMPKFQRYAHRGLQWEVLLQPDRNGYDPMPVRNLSSALVHVTAVRSGDMVLHLPELPYAFYWYELRLRVRVQNVVDEELWSEPFVHRFRTAAQLPDWPPRTDIGSFYVNSSETMVRLYWEELKRYDYNGENFTYLINANEVKIDGSKRHLLPLEMHSHSAVFEWRRDLRYIYEIHSSNHMGQSLTASRIDIFPRSSRNHKLYTPRSIHNVYHATNRTYTLTWEAPIVTHDLLDYTVYWCYSKRALQTQCNGSIHFQHVSRNTQRFTTEPQSSEREHTLNLAVSANYDKYNTGMHWTACTVDVNSDLVRMEPEAQVISDTSIKVQWSAESVCPSIVDGYNLTFCELATQDNNPSESASECIDGREVTYTINKNLKKKELQKLKPYTWYKIEMLMFSSIKVGRISEPLLVRTEEAAPSPPRELRLLKVSNTTARIEWLPPKKPNGVIREYIVKANSKNYVLNETEWDPERPITFDLDKLNSFTQYSIVVVAKTVAESKPSNIVWTTTPISYPNNATNINYFNENATYAKLQWNKPEEPAGGRLDFYEVSVTLLRNNIIERRHISLVVGTSCRMRSPSCPDSEYKTEIKVRAVNAALRASEVSEEDLNEWSHDDDETYINFDSDDDDDFSCVSDKKSSAHVDDLRRKGWYNKTVYRLYKSPWHMGALNFCTSTQYGKFPLIAAVTVIIPLILVSIMLLIGTKKWNQMRNISCKLPEGLNMYIAKEGGNSFTAPLDKEEQPTAVSSELLVKEVHNEKHHLLGSLTNDSGYLGGVSAFCRSVDASVQEATDSSGESNHSRREDDEVTCSDNGYNGRMRLNSENSAEFLVGGGGSTTDSGSSGENNVENQQQLANSEAANLQLKRLAQNRTNDGYIQAPLATHALTAAGGGGGGGGYIKPGSLGGWPQKPVAPPVTTANNNGYVSADCLPHEEIPLTFASEPRAVPIPIAPSGYVQPSALPKIMTSPPLQTPLVPAANIGGYTTLQQLSKMGSTATQSPLQSNAVPPGISGYVTQRELNAFGQQQQQQQQLY